ncbi:hypothetical protein CANINC_004861 [Pichia inconspicua]|uniref:Glucose-signaling factor 2 n=1 Tax=Pichia inconspicua TaxID=52247 RepID=A0A4T0WWI2_9ASCO|nr:hypothetical protein CANINC_004861 [[Candida] inconspicua]
MTSTEEELKLDQSAYKEKLNESGLDHRLLNLTDDSFDIYIRMKYSADSDFCFQVTSSTSFRDLFKIFKTVPIVLSPSIFYDQIPIGFAISQHPGYLSRTGAIIFDTNAHDQKYLKNVDLDAKLKDNVLPGQLIVPHFQERTFLKYSIISLLLVWLYTDLPDFISPTPGICLTNHATVFITYVLREWLNLPQQAQRFYDDIFEPVGIVGQCIYFIFHIVKIAMFYLILWAGMFNPYKFSLVRQKLDSLTKDDLIEIGWTSAVKAQKLQYQDEYRKFLIAQHGSIMNIFKAGKLGYIKECVIELKNGEGYASSLPQTDDIEVPFKLTFDLLMKERAYFNRRLQSLEPSKIFEEIKKYRTFGPKYPCPELQTLVDKKFEKINLEIQESNVKTNPIFASLNKKEN